MDADRLQKLFDSYMEKFETFHHSENHELYKWAAASHFQKFWDLDADNFGEMYKTALEDTVNIKENTAAWQPVNGPVFLCRQGREIMENVRNSFRELFVDDHSDYSLRQEKIEKFVSVMNRLLKETAPEQWALYHQEVSSAMTYLAFADPDDNFMYNETEAAEFAEYAGFHEELTADDRLNLPNYYKMCGELTSELQQQSDLCQMVSDALEEEADQIDDSAVAEIDGEYHILAYDIMFCAHTYDLYEEDIPSPGKKSEKKKTAVSKNEIPEEDILKKKEKELKKELDKAVKKRKQLQFPEVSGQTVQHKKYGKGRVEKQEDRYITVVFDSGTKTFVLPDAFARGFLTADSEDAADLCRKIAELDAVIAGRQRELDLCIIQKNGWSSPAVK